MRKHTGRKVMACLHADDQTHVTDLPPAVPFRLTRNSFRPSAYRSVQNGEKTFSTTTKHTKISFRNRNFYTVKTQKNLFWIKKWLPKLHKKLMRLCYVNT